MVDVSVPPLRAITPCCSEADRPGTSFTSSEVVSIGTVVDVVDVGAVVGVASVVDVVDVVFVVVEVVEGSPGAGAVSAKDGARTASWDPSVAASSAVATRSRGFHSVSRRICFPSICRRPWAPENLRRFRHSLPAGQATRLQPAVLSSVLRKRR